MTTQLIYIRYFLIISLIPLSLSCIGIADNSNSKNDEGTIGILSADDWQLIQDISYPSNPELWKILTEDHPAYIILNETEIENQPECKPLTIDELNEIAHAKSRHEKLKELGFIPIHASRNTHNKSIDEHTYIYYARCKTSKTWNVTDFLSSGYMHFVKLRNRERDDFSYNYVDKDPERRRKQYLENVYFVEKNKRDLSNVDVRNRLFFEYNDLTYESHGKDAYYAGFTIRFLEN